MAKLGDPVPIKEEVFSRVIKRGFDRGLSRVYQVGVELEGGWTKLPAGVTQLERDTSVFRHGVPLGGPPVYAHGELPSPVRDVKEGSPLDFRAWMRKHYPHVVDATCGMHVHMSFTTALTYQRCMTPRFPATIVCEMSTWAKKEGLPEGHAIWPRLLNQVEYCKHEYSGDRQVTATGKDHDRGRTGNRYTVVNYAYGRHKTAEVRLLPMFDTCDQAIRAVEHLINVTNAFLLTTARRETKFVKDLNDESVATKIERNVRV